MLPTVDIRVGDWVDRLKELMPCSIPLVVTSPPYGNLRTYGLDSLDWKFQEGAKELSRVLTHGGVICWNVGAEVIDGSESLDPFKQAIWFVEGCGLKLHDTMIYEKKNFGHPERARYHQLFEYVFVFSKGKPATFNPIKDKRNITNGHGPFSTSTMRQRDGSQKKKKRNIATEFGMRGNVWTGNTRGQEEVCKELSHPAMMPKWLAHDLILSFSNVGDTVLDPMCGSGTVCQQAHKLARHTIGFDIKEEYVKDALTRCHVTPGLPL